MNLELNCRWCSCLHLTRPRSMGSNRRLFHLKMMGFPSWESLLPRVHFQVSCWFSGVYIYIYIPRISISTHRCVVRSSPFNLFSNCPCHSISAKRGLEKKHTCSIWCGPFWCRGAKNWNRHNLKNSKAFIRGTIHVDIHMIPYIYIYLYVYIHISWDTLEPKKPNYDNYEGSLSRDLVYVKD